MTKKIIFEVGELSDAYALRTLYDYLKKTEFERRTDVKIYFNERSLKIFNSILLGCPTYERECELETSLYVQILSDLGYVMDENQLLIDASILKNCALPMKEEDKIKARELLGIKTELPVLVVSYAKACWWEVKELIGKINTNSEIYIIDGFHENSLPANVHLVDIWGILRAYYAIADVAVNAANLDNRGHYLHNFIEATEGGPLFMVPPEERYRKQFGYKELSDLGVIRNCECAEDLIEKVSKYLQRLIEQIHTENEEHSRKRTKHIVQSREKYLPIIESEIEKMLNNEPSRSGELQIRNQGNERFLQHPETKWT